MQYEFPYKAIIMYACTIVEVVKPVVVLTRVTPGNQLYHDAGVLTSQLILRKVGGMTYTCPWL